MQRGSFFVKEHILANMSFLSYAHVGLSRCARHALESTRSLFICAVSPDLTPLEFFLWGHVKSMVYVTAVTTRAQLMERLNAAFYDVKQNLAMLGRVGRSLLRRYQTCNGAQGRVFEDVL